MRTDAEQDEGGVGNVQAIDITLSATVPQDSPADTEASLRQGPRVTVEAGDQYPNFVVSGRPVVIQTVRLFW